MTKFYQGSESGEATMERMHKEWDDKQKAEIERYREALTIVYILADGYGYNRIADICEDALAEQTEERV